MSRLWELVHVELKVCHRDRSDICVHTDQSVGHLHSVDHHDLHDGPRKLTLSTWGPAFVCFAVAVCSQMNSF